MRKKAPIVGIVLILMVLGISALFGIYFKGETPLHRCTITSLADTSADERYPVWSPDGNKIFFKSDDWICVCNPDGSQRENLTEFKRSFVFSPDMKKVFYVKVPVGEEKVIYQAYAMDVDGKNREKIAELKLEQKYVDGYVEGDWGYIGSTNIGSNRREQYEMCSWGPDRTKIFFTKLEETGYNWVWSEEERKWARYKAGTEPSIHVVQEKGWGELRLIAKEHERTAWIWDLKENELRFVGHLSYGVVTPEEEVVWSTDGKHVALPCSELSKEGDTEQIFVINVETGECERLTSFVGSNTWPKWSPDGEKIMYVRSPPEYWWSPSMGNYYDEGVDIWAVDSDGNNRKQLTDIPKNWEEGYWSPDGSTIAYISHQVTNKRYKICILNEDGSDERLLTKVDTDTEGIESIKWSPDGSKIAFVTWKLSEGEIDCDIYVIDVPAVDEEIKSEN